MNASLVLHRRPLAAVLSILFTATASGTTAVAPVDPAPNTRGAAPATAVENCDDDGPGSLRATIAAAASGDTIDLGALACATISLTTGHIAIAQDDLTLIGPGADSRIRLVGA